MSIILCRPPLLQAQTSTAGLAAEFRKLGVNTAVKTLGSDSLSRALYRLLPSMIASKVERRCMCPYFFRKEFADISAGDVALVYTNGKLVNPLNDIWMESAIKARGAKYVFQLPDAWPLVPSELKKACEHRVHLADLTVCVTPILTDLIRETFPGVKCETCEEAVDTEALLPDDGVEDEPSKTILWSGPPGKSDLIKLKDVLESVFSKHPFVLRVVSGFKKPDYSFSFPWEWVPFSNATQNDAFSGVSAAIAYYGDSPYELCKGNYKVKKYMSAGLPIVTSDLGYNREMIQDGVNGLLAENTPDSWEKKLVRVLEDPELSFRLGMQARQTAVARYSYASIALSYLRVLEKHFPDEVLKSKRD